MASTSNNSAISDIGRRQNKTSDLSTNRHVQRSRIIRRGTTYLNKRANRGEPFIHQILIIQLKKRDDASVDELRGFGGCQAKFIPYISYANPSIEGKESNFPPSLFYPDFTCPWKDQRGSDAGSYTVILTDQNGSRSFAYCHKYRLEDDEKCHNLVAGLSGNSVLVLLSKFPAEIALSDWAIRFVQNLKKEPSSLDTLCRNFLKFEYSTCQSDLASSVYFIDTNFGRTPIVRIFDLFGLETTVYIFLSLLAERRVLVTGESVKVISDIVQMFSRLLAPLDWPHTLIPVIPDTLLDLCYNPTPYLCGIMRQNLDKVKNVIRLSENDDGDEMKEDIIIIDADLQIFSPSVPFKDLSKRERLKLLLFAGGEMGFPKSMIEDLVTSLEKVFPYTNEVKASFKIENRIMVWYSKTFGHYRKWNCINNSIFDEINKQVFVKTHPVHETRQFLKWFVETGLFQIFVDGTSGTYLRNNMKERFEKICEKHAPPMKAKGAKSRTHRTIYRLMNQ